MDKSTDKSLLDELESGPWPTFVKDLKASAAQKSEEKTTDRWSTPQDFFDELNQEFGFTLDVCAEEWNHKCPEYLSPDQDGLSQNWTGVCWMNPPYGKEIRHWVKKAYEECSKGATVVCLIPARTETSWFQDYCLKGEVRFVRGRIHYTDPDGKTGRPRFGNALVIFRPGKIPVPERTETQQKIFKSS